MTKNLFPIGTRVISMRWGYPELCAYMGLVYGLHHVQPVEDRRRKSWAKSDVSGWPSGSYHADAHEIEEIA